MKYDEAERRCARAGRRKGDSGGAVSACSAAAAAARAWRARLICPRSEEVNHEMWRGAAARSAIAGTRDETGVEATNVCVP